MNGDSDIVGQEKRITKEDDVSVSRPTTLVMYVHLSTQRHLPKLPICEHLLVYSPELTVRVVKDDIEDAHPRVRMISACYIQAG